METGRRLKPEQSWSGSGFCETLAPRERVQGEGGVYQVHDWAEVRRLRREEKSIKQIAEELGMSRTAVYRLLGLVATRPSSVTSPASSRTRSWQ